MKKTLIHLFSLSLAVANLNADTYTLRDGTVHIGKIAYETKDSYYLSVEVKPGIRNEIAVKKSVVASIEKSDNSANAFKKLQKLTPTPDLLSADDYERALADIIEPFIKKYPDSQYTQQAKAIQQTLITEHQKVKDGALKINGVFTSAEDRALNAYEVDATLLASDLEKLGRANKLNEAMAVFNELEADYKNTLPFEKAAKKATRFLQSYQAQAQKIVTEGDTIIEKRDKAFQAMTPSTRIRAKQAVAEEENAYQSRLAKAKQNGGKWLPLNRFHPDIAKQVLRSIESEKARLQKITSNAEFIDAGELYRESLSALDKNELNIAKEKIRALSKAKAPDKYVKPLESRLDEAIDTERELERQRREEEREAMIEQREAERKALEEERAELLKQREEQKQQIKEEK